MVTSTTALRPQPATAVAPAPQPRRRSRVGRISRAAALTWLAGTLAFVLSASVLRDRAQRVEVLVASQDIPPGTELTAGLVHTIELDADSPLTASLVHDGALEPGMVTSGVIASGAPIRTDDLAEPANGDRLRSMSIQVDRAQAVGGDLKVGDRVDVIDIVDGAATFVVAGVHVIDVASTETGRRITSGGTTGFFVVVWVDAQQVLALAGAMEDGHLQVVRSTGADPVAAGTALETAPPESGR